MWMQCGSTSEVTAAVAGTVTKRRNVTGTVTNKKCPSLADLKVELVNLHKKRLIEEHDPKMQLIRKECLLKDLQIEEKDLNKKFLKLEIMSKEKYT